MQKTVLITGVSSGIGEATARTLANAGYRVFGGARRPERIAGNPGVELIEMDICDEEQVRTAVSEVLSRAGRIDVLINNAGVSLLGPVEATGATEARELFDTNVFGALSVIQAVLPSMREQKSGLILNISSVLGFLPAPYMGLYAASKHALEGLSETLDHEVRQFGVRVVLVEPSFTKTSLDTNARQTAIQIDAYGAELKSTTEAILRQIQDAPPPEAVAGKILQILKSPHRLRQPADGKAKLLSILRRFVPARHFDKSLRSSFGL